MTWACARGAWVRARARARAAGGLHARRSAELQSRKLQALVIAREIGDRRGEGNHLGNLGNAYLRLGEVRKAIEHYEQALKLFEDIESPHAEAVRRKIAEMRARLDDAATSVASAERR